jgi:CBS domain-containing protein
MNPRTISEELVVEAPLLRQDDEVGKAVAEVVASGLPALPVVDAAGALVGIFGEREFMGAVFPGYLGELRYAGFVKKSLDEALEQRGSCRDEPVSKYMNTEHIDVSGEFSDAQVAETFLHHRVLIVPVKQGGRVTGVITRSAFFRRLAERFLEG